MTVCRFTLLVGRAARVGTVAALLAGVVSARGVAFASDDGAGALRLDQAGSSSAALVVLQLQASVPTLRLQTDYTATNDPDGLLGLPGQYTAKAAFGQGDVPAGYVEVFDTFGDRASRARRLQQQSNTETDISSGKILLRLLPAQKHGDTDVVITDAAPVPIVSAADATVTVGTYQAALATVALP